MYIYIYIYTSINQASSKLSWAMRLRLDALPIIPCVIADEVLCWFRHVRNARFSL